MADLCMYIHTQIHTHQDLVEREHSNAEMQEETEETALSANSKDSSELKLHHAASSGQLEEVRRLVKEGNYNPMDKNENDDTALHCAAENG